MRTIIRCVGENTNTGTLVKNTNMGDGAIGVLFVSERFGWIGHGGFEGQVAYGDPGKGQDGEAC